MITLTDCLKTALLITVTIGDTAILYTQWAAHLHNQDNPVNQDVVEKAAQAVLVVAYQAYPAEKLEMADTIAPVAVQDLDTMARMAIATAAV
jgi:hypothetical protein